MSGYQRRTGAIDHGAESDDLRRRAGTVAERAPSPEPAVTSSADPRLSSPGGATPGLMALQRSAGNAAVTSLVGARPSVQRAVEIEELTTEVGPAPTAQSGPTGATGAGAAQSGPTGAPAGGDAVTSDGSNTTVNGAHITLAAPMVESAGVLRAGTIIADSVVASSYTPGAGNQW